MKYRSTTMLRYILALAAAFLLLSCKTAASCAFTPAPLEDCEVGDNSAALLVRVKCVKTFWCGRSGDAVADVAIDKIFRDKTGLALSEGAMVTVHTTPYGPNGVPDLFQPNHQWILFASERPAREDYVALQAEDVGGNVTLLEILKDDLGIRDDEFSDGTVCTVGDADLTFSSCSRNTLMPSSNDIKQITTGCSSDSFPAVSTKHTS